MIGVCLLSIIVSLPASAGGGAAGYPVVALPADGQLYLGQVDFIDRSSPLDRDGFAFKGGRHLIYLVDVEPGEAYTFGLRMPNLGRPEMDVMLFDRWPYDIDAKMQHLASGSTLMGNQDYIEYQWHLGVSAKSPGNLLYIMVELKKPRKAEYRRFPVRAFVAYPAIDPMRSTGRGVTYGRGPSNLMLQERANHMRIVQAVQPEPGWRLDEGRAMPPPVGVIHNDQFLDGLVSWNLLPGTQQGKELGVSVGAEGLRLWADDLHQRAGVEQVLAPQALRVRPAHLVLDLRIKHQTQRENFESLNDFPLRLDLICKTSGESQPESAQTFSRGFSVVRPAKHSPIGNQVTFVPLNVWYHYESDLTDWLPQGCHLKRIRLSGGGFPERDVRIRQVQILPE